jgi:Ca2+-binding RTX toxin-like protein
LLVASMGAVMVLLSGVALAANVIRCELGSTPLTPCEGTAGNDEMHGATSGSGWPDFMRAKNGDDILYGYLYNDTLHGDDGNDTLYGGVHDDSLWGKDGDDTIYGSLGVDHLRGGAGGDVLDGADPYVLTDPLDVIRGGDGPDSVKAQDSLKDKIDCGPGTDTAYVDAEDVVVKNPDDTPTCENINPPS